MKNCTTWLAIAFTLATTPSARAAEDAKPPMGIILAAGDITGCDKDEMERATATAAVLGRELAQWRAASVPVKVIILGDLAYDDGSPEEFKCFDKTWGQVLRKELKDVDADALPVPGNHDFRTKGAKGYRTFFATNKWANTTADGYYGLTFPEGQTGAWTLLGMNSETEDNKPQLDWLSEALKANRSRCVMGFWHRPVFSSGHHGHGDDGDSKNDGSTPVKQKHMAQEEGLMAKAGSSLILNGHDHNYEELEPHTQTGDPSATGLRSFIIGTGGRKLRPNPGKTWPAISKNFDANTYGILRLALYPDSYAWAMLPAHGTSAAKYQGTATCNTPPATQK